MLTPTKRVGGELSDEPSLVTYGHDGVDGHRRHEGGKQILVWEEQVL